MSYIAGQNGQSRPTAEEERLSDRKHLSLWIAVGGTMALVAVIWMLLLPLQLKREGMNSALRTSRWSTTPATEQVGSMQEFRDKLQGMKTRVNLDTNLNLNLNEPAPGQKLEAAPVTQPDVAAIRQDLAEKLEAAADKDKNANVNSAP